MSRLLTLDAAVEARDRLRLAGHTLVFTNGCFDLLHVGHIHTLEVAADHGDVLWVGVNDDTSVRLLKGKLRPLVPWEERARVVAALRAVDGVLPIVHVTAAPLLANLRPEVYVKGGDYSPATLPEIHVVRALGIRLVLVPPVPGKSSSGLVERIVHQHRD
ncbi:MAG: adenylyltransferase/cytidyltransferase family protein [Ardenticatenia bacterium]|nr:adenylyltransferase/cytidyltransferase family protein [Ardenticatenia bacterium]